MESSLNGWEHNFTRIFECCCGMMSERRRRQHFNQHRPCFLTFCFSCGKKGFETNFWIGIAQELEQNKNRSLTRHFSQKLCCQDPIVLFDRLTQLHQVINRNGKQITVFCCAKCLLRQYLDVSLRGIL